MLKGIYVDVNADSNIFKIKNGRNDVICKVTDLESALALVNEIKKLQDDIRNTFNKLVEATHFNGIYLYAIKEFIYNNNPAPAEEVLAEINPKFSENHTTPNQFLELNESNRKFLIDEIVVHEGDVFYNAIDKEFIIFKEIYKGIYNFSTKELLKGYSCDKSCIGENVIPCYTPHQLWNFLENFLNEKVEIKSKEGEYKVYSPVFGSCLGSSKDKLEALWNSVINLLE